MNSAIRFVPQLGMHPLRITAGFLSAAAFVSCLAAASAFPQEKPTNLSDARSAVEANLRTSEGKAFDGQIGKEFQEKYLGALRDCKKSANGDATSFWILMKLDKDGIVKEVLLSPTTKFGSCARDMLLKGKFAAPPKGAYWVSIYLQLSH